MHGKIREKVGRVAKLPLRLFRTTFGFQLPRKIFDKLSYDDPNKSKCLILNRKRNGTHDYYEIRSKEQIVRKRRIFDDNGKYVKSEISFYDRNGVVKASKKVIMEDISEVERDSLIFSELPKEVVEQLEKHGFGSKYKVDTNFDAECEVSFLRMGNMFEQKVRYKLRNGNVVVDVAYFDEKGRQIKVVKNFALIKKNNN
ncbi:MAG: hypothetical protein QXD98_03155 [Candidatus Diapherotrites archaeon]